MTIPIITLTDAAALHIKNMLSQNKKGIGFRLSIKETGCSGYAYLPKIIEEKKEDDLYFNQAELNIYLDPKALKFINGLTIDYVEEGSQGIKQKRLIFINPNEKNRCGCGESFTVE